MANPTKSTSHVYLSAHGSIPPEGDPRWMSAEEVLAKVDELAAETADILSSATARQPDQPRARTIADIAPVAWANWNGAGKGTR